MDSGKSSPSNLSRSNSLRLSIPNVNNCSRTSLVRRNQSLNAKQIHFFRNGDRYFSGLKLAVSPDRYKEFDSLLTELSSKLNLSSGAVRFVFNADSGILITDVAELQYGIAYVCSSSNTYRNIEGGYGKSQNSSNKTKSQKRHLQTIDTNSSLRNENVSSKDFIKPKLVTVIRTGKPPQKKVTLLLNTKTAISLDQVLDQLSAKGSLGKVDKLHTTDGKPIRALRDLFDDNTVFIALSTKEKFPEDGIELDPNSYRITPFREIKKPGGMVVRRSNSLRHSLRYKDENENMSSSRIPKNRKTNNLKVITKVARPRAGTLKNNSQNVKEELYPTSVFASDSESAKAKTMRKNRATKKSASKLATDMDIYNTVWLSDSVRSCVTQSVCSTVDDQGGDSVAETSLGYSMSRTQTPTEENSINTLSICRLVKQKHLIYRTLSLPELSHLTGIELRHRFVHLQLEQENRELHDLVQELRVNLRESLVDENRTSYKGTRTLCYNSDVDKSFLDDSLTPHSSKFEQPSSSLILLETSSKYDSGYDTLPTDRMLYDDEEFRFNNDRRDAVNFHDDDDDDDYVSNVSDDEDLREHDRYFKSRLLRMPTDFHEEDGNSCCRLQ